MDRRIPKPPSTDVATVPRRIQAQDTAIESFARYRIEVVGGVDVGQSLVCSSGPSRAFVGTSRACALRLSDPLVSRRHLALDVTSDGLHLVDLDSTNGSFLDGLRVKELWLYGAGETVTVGETSLRVERCGDAPAIESSDAVAFGRMLGASPAMRRLYPLCQRLARTDLPILVEGETGTGKEVLAEALHEASARANGPFIVFDCGAVPASLAESAIFGHERGSFTGAESARQGVFEAAHGGTLFLDELGELPLDLQPKLLRALERGEVQRVGSNRWTAVDVRVISATRRDVDREVQDGRFREDLFYRLAVGRIELPPLRRRRGDVALLARHFWRDMSHDGALLPEDVVRRLESWQWPGNVRELHHAIARFRALGEVEHATGGRDDAPVDGEAFASVLALNLPLAIARAKVVEAFERSYIEAVLAKHRGNVSRAAQSSGLARRYFQLLRARRGGDPR